MRKREIMNMGRKQELINCIIDNDLNTFYESGSDGVQSVLNWGFKGYQNYTEEELVQEMNERDLWDSWFKENV
jgi:hypothetical protein